VARQPGTGSAEGSSEAPVDEFDPAEIDDESGDGVTDVEDDLDEAPAVRSAETDALWTDVRVQPIEIALTTGVGYTLRAYRLSTEVREPEIGDRDDDFPSRSTVQLDDDVELDEHELPEFDEAELTAQALAAGRDDEDTGKHRADDGTDQDDDADADDADQDAGTVAEQNAGGADADDHEDDDHEDDDHEDDDHEDDESDGDAEAAAEDVPVFLAADGKLLLFHSPEGLVEFVHSGAENELTQLDTWDELRERIEVGDIVPLDEDRYELDLLVENLRGGHNLWDPALIIQSGEIARDIAFALRVPAVIAALAPGSPLDDLDEGLRAVETGGLGSLFARRRLRKIDPQTTAALGWRTIIGKISAVVDWRD
jgi:hypothetical protein